MARTRINPEEETVRLELRLPKSVKEWLDSEPGGMSKTVRRLVKEEVWRREGRYTEPEEGSRR